MSRREREKDGEKKDQKNIVREGKKRRRRKERPKRYCHGGKGKKIDKGNGGERIRKRRGQRLGGKLSPQTARVVVVRVMEGEGEQRESQGKEH